MTTFVKIGDRVEIFQRPHSQEESEGKGVVVAVSVNADMESAFVGGELDDDDDKEPVWRWLLPKHVIRK